MGLEKFIIKQVVNVAKDSSKIQDSVVVMEDKLTAEVLKLIEGSGINPQLLPFDPIKLIKGEETLNPSTILKPEVLCLIPPLTTSQQEKAQSLTNNLKLTTSSIVDNINSLKDALVTVQQPLINLNVTSESLENVLKKVSASIKVIKSIPIPVAVGMPAVAIPIKVLTILSDILVQSDKIITAGKGVTSAVSPLIESVLEVITKTIISVNTVVTKIEPVLTILSFIQAKITLGNKCPNVTQAEINSIQSLISSDLQSDIAALGDSSISAINILNENELTNSLQPNSNPPFEYKGFILILEFDPNNQYSFPRRRIRADRNFTSGTSSFFTIGPQRTPLNGLITLYNDPTNQGKYSFSSSVQILVKEMQYKIDQYLLGVAEIANLEEATDENRNTDVGEEETLPPQWLEGYVINYNENIGNDIVTPDSPQLGGTIVIPEGLDTTLSVALNLTLGTGQYVSNQTVLFITPPTGDPIPSTFYKDNTSFLDSGDPIIISSPGIYEFNITMLLPPGYPTSPQNQTELLITVL